MSIVVLAGGKSFRLGRDKLFETLGGQTLLGRVLSALSSLGEEIIVVTSSPERPLPSLPQGKVRVVSDVFPGKGSLGGVYTGLVEAKSRHSLVVGGDMPFLNLSLLRYMMGLCPDYDVVVPRIGTLLEPLHAFYYKDCLAPIKRMFEEGRLSFSEFYPSVRVRYVEEEEVNRFDPQHLSFFNINTEADLEQARTLITARRGSEGNA